MSDTNQPQHQQATSRRMDDQEIINNIDFYQNMDCVNEEADWEAIEAVNNVNGSNAFDKNEKFDEAKKAQDEK